MAHFVTDNNNGVTAVLTIDDFRRLKNGDEPLVGFMLFSDTVDYPGAPREIWIHGNRALMAQLLQGHSLEHGSIWVPFSNGPHLYPSQADLLEQLRRIAPTHKLLEAFGMQVSPAAVAVS